MVSKNPENNQAFGLLADSRDLWYNINEDAMDCILY
jgi:hypothetical protein